MLDGISLLSLNMSCLRLLFSCNVTPSPKIIVSKSVCCKPLLSITAPSGMAMAFIAVPIKACVDIVTFSGNIISQRSLQFANARQLILVKLEGKVTFFSMVSSKAESPTLLNYCQVQMKFLLFLLSLKALFPIDITVEGIIIDFRL